MQCYQVNSEIRKVRPRIRSEFPTGTAGILRKAIPVALMCLISTSCSNRDTSTFSSEIYGKASPRVVQPGEPVPKGGGKYIVGVPYRIAGKWYYPKHDPSYTEIGNSSWYGPIFHGRLTANGEVYDREGLSAAHPTMPLPSYARVTNMRNGSSIVVRVNDRGPFHSNRMVDVSEKAAEILEFKQRGVEKVKIEYLGKARMDGLDYQQLYATYRPHGSDSLNNTQFASLVIPRSKPQVTTNVASISQGSVQTSGPVTIPRRRPNQSSRVGTTNANANSESVAIPRSRPVDAG